VISFVIVIFDFSLPLRFSLIEAVPILCGSRKYPHYPHRRDWNFLRGGGSMRQPHLKKYMKLNWSFQRGGEMLGKSLRWEVWKFSGTTHFTKNLEQNFHPQ